MASVLRQHSHLTFCFVGVTTGQSSINRIWPLWMERLGRPEVRLQGIDHPIHDDPAHYRRTVEEIRSDPTVLGGLVTTHKMDLYAAASDLFDTLDAYARTTHEVSCITRRDGNLEGAAVDPITVGLTLDALVGENYFARTGGELLCFGAGGSGVATLLHLLNKRESEDRPRRFVAVDRDQARLDHMAEMAANLGSTIPVDYVLSANPAANDTLMGAMAEASLIINATGMGKDLPGSPLTDAGLFPRYGLAWDFNYRGTLDFLTQARRQAATRLVRTEDGWDLFVRGWTHVIGHVLQVEITPPLFRELAKLAVTAR